MSDDDKTALVALNLVESLEWSDARLGAAPREKFADATRFEACPLCGGIKPRSRPDPVDHFPPHRIGHAPNCLFPEALGTDE